MCKLIKNYIRDEFFNKGQSFPDFCPLLKEEINIKIKMVIPKDLEIWLDECKKSMVGNITMDDIKKIIDLTKKRSI